MIELIEPIDDNSPVINIINRDISIYHICYSVKNLDETINLMRKKGFIPIGKPVPAIALQSRNLVFLFSKDKIMIELIEEE
ncbi:MAG: VOC family protein [candidate division WOR-3 bacterium]